MPTAPTLTLTGFHFQDLLHAEGLKRLDEAFLQALSIHDPLLKEQLLVYRQTQPLITPEISEFLITLAKILETFLASLFQIQEALAISQIHTQEHNPVAVFKQYFVLRRAKKEVHKAHLLPSFAALDAWLKEALSASPLQSQDQELAVALLGQYYLTDPNTHQAALDQLVAWCTQALATPEGQAATAAWVSFRVPQRIEAQALVPVVPVAQDSYQRSASPTLRARDGFDLTDKRMNARQVQDEVNYCIYCHDHAGDFCSKGFPAKKGDPTQGYKKNALDTLLTGCPLEEKISEMHLLKRDGHTLAALAMIMVDNPLCPATGHRICNDCMKACIYQKQDPVNIPQIETRVLTDVLALPWGVELYDLLTRWNPLRHTQWVMQPYNGLKVMIAGMGPAGFTLAHHLLLEGCAVVGFDGLKIEPLPSAWLKEPIYRFADIISPLDERMMAGFGGVAEYGITARWDKNFLKLIYLSLARRPYFQVFGSTRFGGTIQVADAWELGFDHFAIAVGAGLPKALPIPNSMAPGMRQANDFLMALQLGSAAKMSSLTSLQIRLPAVVIGGGLTGVDTATELQAYYVTQVEKILTRYEKLTAAGLWQEKNWDEATQEILKEYLQHGKALRAEREQAKLEKRAPRFIELIRAWGGVTIVYRRAMQSSPAYINNHEELNKALEEGIYYRDQLEPAAVELNPYGHAEALLCHERIQDQHQHWHTTQNIIRLPARSILVATGTQPNTAYEFEHRGSFARRHTQYLHYEENDQGELSLAENVAHCKENDFGPFTSYQHHDKRVSLVGDTHPVFHGSVVKAIASGMRTYPKIMASLKSTTLCDDYVDFAARIRAWFRAEIIHVIRHTKNILEIVVHAPLAAKHYQPGQFYRLQNYETDAVLQENTLLQMEPLALTAAACDKEQGHLHFLIEQETAAAKLCSLLKPGMRVALMGPTGVRAKIPQTPETILIVTEGQTSFAFVQSVGKALRTAGSRVIAIIATEKATTIYCQQALEAASDEIIWAIAQSPVDVLYQQAENIKLQQVDRIYVLGNTELLRQFQIARHSTLKPYLSHQPKIIGSVYGHMQCMLKGVCAQCLQWQIDPATGKRTKAVFACSWQDQPLELIDIDHLAMRSMQNQVLEKINQMWVDYLLMQMASSLT